MFPGPTPDGTITVYVTPRPMRLAVILDADSPSATRDFQEVSLHFFQQWGGQYNAIIPSNDGAIAGEWYRLLELVDPDCVYALSTLDDSTVFRINRELAPAVFRHGLWDARAEGGRFRFLQLQREDPALITGIPNAIDGLRSSLFTPVFFYIAGEPGEEPYAKFIALNFGVLPASAEYDNAFRDLSHVQFDLTCDPAHQTFVRILEAGHNAFTPARLGTFRADPAASTYSGRYGHRFNIIVGDSVRDLALARALRMFETHRDWCRSIWWPIALCDNENARGSLRAFIMRSYWSDDNMKMCQIISLSASHDTVDKLARALSSDYRVQAEVVSIDEDDLGFPTPSDVLTSTPGTTTRSMFLGPSLTRARSCGLVDQEGSVDPPIPEFLSGIPGQAQIMLDLAVPFRRNDRSRVTYKSGPFGFWRLPRRQGLAHAFTPASRLARITRAGYPSVLLTRETQILQIRIPSPFKLFECWATNRYIDGHDVAGLRDRRFVQWRVSDEGRFLEALVRLFGSPFACGHTLAEPFWGPALRFIALGSQDHSDVTAESVNRGLSLLVEHEGAPNLSVPEELSRAARFLAAHIRASSREQKAISKKQLFRLFGRLKKEAEPDDPYWTKATWNKFGLDDDLDLYVDADIPRMGVTLRCPACLTSQWILVDEMASAALCRGCGANVRIGAEPEWSYRVNSLAAEAIRRRGVIAVVQAIYKAEERIPGSTLVVLPSLDVLDADKTQPFTDVDFVYFTERELVIGEVKSAPTGFFQDDLGKLSAVAEDLLPNRVVIAAPGDDWPTEIQQRVDELKVEQAGLGIAWEIRKLHW